MASPRFPGDAHLRHDGGDPPSCQSAAAKKNETPNHGKNKTNAVSSLIRWSIQEVRRIAIRLARKRIPTRPHHRMVSLAQNSPGDRSARTLQGKTTTVMLGVWCR